MENQPLENPSPVPKTIDRRCGTCAHGVRIALTQLTCYGVPPTPCIIGTSPGPHGSTNFIFNNQRPVLETSERHCGLYEFTESQACDITKMKMGGVLGAGPPAPGQKMQ